MVKKTRKVTKKVDNGWGIIGSGTASKIGQVASLAADTAKKVALMLNSEAHHFDTNLTFNMPVAGRIDLITGIALGTTAAGTHLYQEVLLNSIDRRETLSSNMASLSQSEFCRIIMFSDKQEVSNTSPVVLDVLESADVRSYLNRNNLGRFKIYRDEVFSFCGSGNQTRFDNKIVNFKNHHIRWDESGSLAKRGHVYVLHISDNTDASVLATYRVNYHQN